MTRSLWKPPFSDISVFQTIFYNDKKPIFILYHNSWIFPSFVGNTFLFYNGKKLISLQILEHMVGYKFSQCISNRRKVFNQ